MKTIALSNTDKFDADSIASILKHLAKNHGVSAKELAIYGCEVDWFDAPLPTFTNFKIIADTIGIQWMTGPNNTVAFEALHKNAVTKFVIKFDDKPVTDLPVIDSDDEEFAHGGAVGAVSAALALGAIAAMGLVAAKARK